MNKKLLIADEHGIRVVKPYLFFWYKTIARFDSIPEALIYLNR